MRPGLVSTTLLLCGLGASLTSAQAPATDTARLDIVEVVGCLSEQPKGTWLLTDATAPAVSKEPYTNKSAIEKAQATPLGDHRYGLLAISMFNPESLKGHKVAVKGLLVKDPKGDRLNVTSLQTASAKCP